MQQDFSATVLVNESPEEVFNAVTNVRGWWSENIEGGTTRLNDEFNYHYKDVHLCKIRITEIVPGEKVSWLVLDNYFNFIEDKQEWVNTTIHFDISRAGDKTQLRFTHKGLVPGYECYDICHDAWNGYIKKSLHGLITTGKGNPTAFDKDSSFNDGLLHKYVDTHK